jgi:KUP system potassium uptake protein
MIQRFGTKSIGGSFGPVMLVWFGMLGVLGTIQILQYPGIIAALNPVYAFQLLAHHPNGFLLLGAVFLCTTGAEALYSDLGHCGLQNIRVTWILVKTTLVLNYLGQGAWLMQNSNVNTETINPFFSIMPDWFLVIGIFISTMAAIIASQALITGSFTIVSEAILLNFWPKVKIIYPTTIKGQMFIPSVNRFLWISCLMVIIFFRESSAMEAAYGLSITITMLMTTVLLGFYFYINKISSYIIGFFLLVYLIIEGSFLVANLNKFLHGGWVTIIIAGFIFMIMYVWFKGRAIKNRFLSFIKIQNYYEWFADLKVDQGITKYATNLVYLTKADKKTDVESKIIYSIFNKQPKRADMYWLLHIDILDNPHTMDYKVDVLIPGTLVRIDFKLGFKVQPRINLYLRQVIHDLVKAQEVDILSQYETLRKHHVPGDFRFVIIERIQNYDFDFKYFEQFIMDTYTVLKNIGTPDVKAYGLDTSNVVVEKVPLQLDEEKPLKLRRIY